MVSRGGSPCRRTESSRPHVPQAQQLTGDASCLGEKGVLLSHVWYGTRAPLVLVGMEWFCTRANESRIWPAVNSFLYLGLK